ncbi:MAG: DUF4435 domain-containing protein [Bacteroidetes bacterium]|nr:DUF4435 domain-containing protein [Bacteroidota bacterium]
MEPNLPSEIVNEIRLQRQSFDGSLLIVEGRDDRLSFQKFVDQEKCEIIVANGKGNVIDVVVKLRVQLCDGVVGVVDADFDHIENTLPLIENIIVLETVDLEALLIRSPALESLLSECGQMKKIAQAEKDIRSVLIEAAVWIGCLRLFSHRGGGQLKFQGLKFRKFIDRQSLKIDIQALVHKVLNRSVGPRMPPIPEVVANLKTLRDTIIDDWLVCLGKDMVEVLTVALRRKI